MPSLLEGPVITEERKTSSTVAPVELAAPFNRAHIEAEFREDRPLWKRVLHAAGAPFRWLSDPYWSTWDPHSRPEAWWPTLMGDMELPLARPPYSTFRRCCSDHPDGV